ncbi:flagellar hook-basal body complex protein [Paracoccus sp. p4-l81]|uniref:flagellar hook-basal body complex protein n=1 Tax=unclassified Paracoccus (in: a-proteobacteria) TaxID=2688777 RepID=UPI0035B6CFD6
MDNAIYATLTRQSGLMREMQAVANNIANVSTGGFRREGMVFAEHVAALDRDAPSLSMATARGRVIDLSQGGLTTTGGTFDFAIEGEGFFQVQAGDRRLLTRAGSFIPTPEGELMTPDGARLLDGGGAPVNVPPGATNIHLSGDGTLSADGQPVAQLGAVQPADANSLTHEGGTRFAFQGELEPVEESRLMQGALEDSNVNPVTEIARMIEVQRAYEMGQTFLDREDNRIKTAISTLIR